jgi:hypothetical protein
MNKWGFWDWIAYGCLFTAALILAADQGLKGAPEVAAHLPNVLGRGLWSFAPLIFLLMATGIFLIRELGPPRVQAPSQPVVQRDASEIKTHISSDNVLPVDEGSPHFLMDLYKERTRIEGDALVQPYIGKWLVVYGTVRNVSTETDDTIRITLEMEGPNSRKDIVFVDFDAAWIPRVSILGKNSKIRAIGQIGRVDHNTIFLKHSNLTPGGPIIYATRA